MPVAIAGTSIAISTVMRTRLLLLLAVVPACRSEALDVPAQTPAATTVTASTAKVRMGAVTVTPIEPVSPMALASLGYQIDVPASWQLKKLDDMVYTFRLPPVKRDGVTNLPRLEVMRADVTGSRRCPGTLADKVTLEGGAHYQVCEQQVAGLTIRDFRLVIPGADVTCGGSGVDIDATLAACRTLRKLKS